MKNLHKKLMEAGLNDYELINLTENDLLKLKGFGVTTVRNVKVYLKSKGLSLKDCKGIKTKKFCIHCGHHSTILE
jgi:DNA-directed RNA polymerase alpha subunit